MGQTTASQTNKNIRSEFLKTNNPNQQYVSSSGTGGNGGGGGGGGQANVNSNLGYGSYPSEDLNEDEETLCPTINSKSSYVIHFFLVAILYCFF